MTQTQMDSCAISTENEAIFMRSVDRFIGSVVFNFAHSGGNWDNNRSHVEDMLQEARMAVLSLFRYRGSQPGDNALHYGSTIRRACKRVLSKSGNISIPFYWFGSKGKDMHLHYCESLDDDCNDDWTYHSPVEFEDRLVDRLLIEELMASLRDKERTVLRLVAEGFTPTEINRMTGVHRYSIKRYLDKSRKILEGEMIGRTRTAVAATA